MVTWKVLELAALASAFGGIAWGVRYFFIPPARTTKAVWLVAPAATLTCLAQAHAIWYGGIVPTRAFAALTLYAASMALYWSTLIAARRQPLAAIYGGDQPGPVIAQGPYRYLRHPFYVSYSLCWMAGATAGATWYAVAGAALMIGLYAHAARREEAAFAHSRHAAHYAAYASTAGFFWPRLSHF